MEFPRRQPVNAAWSVTNDLHALTKAGFSDSGVSPSGSGAGHILYVGFMVGQIHIHPSPNH
jgi:hypothetical protein